MSSTSPDPDPVETPVASGSDRRRFLGAAAIGVGVAATPLGILS